MFEPSEVSSEGYIPINLISPRTYEKLTFEYSALPDTLAPVEPMKAPTPEESIQLAIKHMEKLKKKGMLNDFDPKRLENNLYRTKYIILTKKAKEQTADDENKPSKKINNEPFMARWHNSDTVNKIKSELLKLPFKDESIKNATLSKFTEEISSVVRTMNNQKMFNPKRKSVKHDRYVMTYFINSMQDLRKKLIQNLIKDKLMDENKITLSLKEEFKDSFSVEKTQISSTKYDPKTTKKDPTVEKKIAIQILCIADTITPSYKINTEYCFDDESREATMKEKQAKVKELGQYFATAKLSSRSAMAQAPPKIIQPEVKHKTKIIMDNNYVRRNPLPEPLPPLPPPKMTKKEVHRSFWVSEDPLIEQREGKSALLTLDEFDGFAADFDIGGDELHLTKEELYYPFKPPETPPSSKETRPPSRGHQNSEGPTLMGDVWNTADIPSQVNDDQETANDDDVNQNVSDLGFDPNNMQYQDLRKNRAALEYLESINPTIIMAGKANNVIFNRLENVWSKLGFTIAQKLAIVAKYTSSAEESQRLGDAVRFWETTLDISTHFLEMYGKLRDFLKFEAIGYKDVPRTTLDALYKEYANARELLLDNATRLKTVFGDDLILNRHIYTDLIAKKQDKIKRLLEEAGIDYNMV